MKAAVLEAPGRLEIKDVPEPECPRGGILVETRACTICSTDLKMFRTGHRDLIYPRVLGHEVSGTVRESDASDQNIEIGDRVQVWPGIPCSSCPSCLKGADNMCKGIGIIGFNRDGGFAELLAVPRENIVAGGANLVPDNVSFEEASLAEPLACCINGQENARIASGDNVLIYGAGPIGLLHAMLAQHKGVNVTIVDPDIGRLALARSLGAARTVDPSLDDVSRTVSEATDGNGVDAIILSTPMAVIDDGLLSMMAPRGRLCIFSGLPKESAKVALDLNTVHYRELSVVGAYGCTSKSDTEAVRLIANGAVDVSKLITRTLSLDRLEEGFRHMELKEGLKCVVNEF